MYGHGKFGLIEGKIARANGVFEVQDIGGARASTRFDTQAHHQVTRALVLGQTSNVLKGIFC